MRAPITLTAAATRSPEKNAGSVIGALIGEWIGASAGLGYLMIRAAAQFHTDRVFAAVLVSALVSIALFASVTWLERQTLPWRTRPRTEP
jgi:ABC-type nitrate/sulfonate/bicarbonate transport system permease component